MKHNEVISLAKVQDFVHLPQLALALRRSSVGVKGVIPSESELREPQMAEVMLRVMRDGFAREDPSLRFQFPAQNESELMKVYKRGHLQADLDENGTGTVYIIPTRFHFM
jgi:hypothetical protein